MDNKVAEAAASIEKHAHIRPVIGAILGSGLGGLAEELEDAVRVPYGQIPHFQVSSVSGHSGELVVGTLAGAGVCFLSGRVHRYEGLAMERIVFPVRVLAALGVLTLIVTNAAGAVNEKFRPGDIAVLDDHINLLGDNPLRGADGIVDLSEPYDGKLRLQALQSAEELGLKRLSGVYAAVCGPSYETPAEVKALNILGADLVGMSTVPEVIMACFLDMQVLGLSMVTNMAAGMGKNTLSHTEVIAIGEKVSVTFKSLVKKIILQVAKS